MPLKSGHSEKTIGENIRELHSGPQYSRTKAAHGPSVANKQAIAVAESVARRAKERAHGGRTEAEAVLPSDHRLGMQVPKGGSMCANCKYLATPQACGNEGFIKWNGEAKLPHPSDEYCCDLYEHGSKQHRATGGKVHVGPIKGKHPGRTDVHEMKVPDGAYVLSADVVSHLGANNSEAGLRLAEHLFGEKGVFDKGEVRKAGGRVPRSGQPIDCVTAGGEFVVPPSTVASIGHGDMDLGHKILDQWSMNIRKDHIATLKNLPPPARD